MPDDSADGKAGRPDSVEPRSRSNRTVTPAIAAALVVLAASFALSVAFVLANGGLDLPTAQRSSSSAGAVAGGHVASPTPVPTAVAEASVAPPGGSYAPSPATTTPAPTPEATPALAVTPKPSSNRYDLLTACPDQAGCWVYVVRDGDNLFSIARYFGVPLAVVEERNPWTRTTQLVAGQKLLLPPPTR
ncbi:MAG: LysM peptidoglycan-binding domain-containing protein [Chloroflexi bacterium]|nr:LysM peptidoglycan-binding domain-containing protein [Chloroflexota bacterium]